VDADFADLGLGMDEIDEFFDEGVEGEGQGAEFDAAGEFEEVVEGLAEAVGFFFEGGETEEGALGAGEGGEVFFHELEVELEGGEGIFEFVGEAGGEFAHFGEAV
jgi:hypothetical protein